MTYFRTVPFVAPRELNREMRMAREDTEFQPRSSPFPKIGLVSSSRAKALGRLAALHNPEVLKGRGK